MPTLIVASAPNSSAYSAAVAGAPQDDADDPYFDDILPLCVQYYVWLRSPMRVAPFVVPLTTL